MKLVDLEPAAIVEAARRHLRAVPAGSTWDKVERDLRDLLRYAQHGFTEAAVHRAMRTMFVDLMPLIFARPGEQFDPFQARLVIHDVEDAVDAVRLTVLMRAVRARLRLAEKKAVDAGDLAVLLGVDASLVRRMARGGQLDRARPTPGGRPRAIRAGRNAPITAASALRVCAARGVSPWGQGASP